MKVEDFLELKCVTDVVILDENYTNERYSSHRNSHLICNSYNELAWTPEIQNADIEYISLYYDDCYYEGDEPSIALHINYKGD